MKQLHRATRGWSSTSGRRLTDPGYDVVTENRYFVAGDGVEWEELSFSVNGSHWGADRPPFPLLQPEKVLSLPLQLRFDEDYRYRLDGTERVDGFDCYVVRFEPVARRCVALSRHGLDRPADLRAHQGAGRAGRPVRAGGLERGDAALYAPSVTVGNQPVFLLHGLTARQIVLIAGRNLLVEKSVDVQRLPRQRRELRRGARGGARAAIASCTARPTSGLRYYVKRGRQPRGQRSRRRRAPRRWPWASSSIRRTPFRCRSSGSTTSTSSSAASGYAARACCLPACWPPATSSGRSFGIDAVRREPRLLRHCGAVERSGLRAGGRAEARARADLAAVDRAQPRMAGHAVPEADVAVPVPLRRRTCATRRRRRRSTCRRAPSPTASAARGNTAAAATACVRQRRLVRAASWKPWGRRPDGRWRRPSPRSLRQVQRQSVARLLPQRVPQGARQRRLVRRPRSRSLRRYQFGLFDDTRIHGVPASGVRFDELAMVRGSYSLNIFEQYRLDLFLEQAWGRDERGTTLAADSGFGVAVNLRRPGIRSCAPTSARASCRTRYRDARLDGRPDHAAEAAPMMTSAARRPARSHVPFERRAAR